MPLNTCPRCQRANPAEAVYCHHDGMALRVPEGGVGSLPHAFVFSSGRRCRTYDELVQGVLQPASLRVLRGWQEGREYALDKASSLLGRDEHADIALFRDMKVEKKHAVIRRERSGYVLVNNGAPPEQTLVNGQSVRDRHDLKDGDRIQLGNVILRFQTRAAAGRNPKSERRNPKEIQKAKSQ